MDAGQTLGPGATQEAGQYRLRLVVEGVRRSHRVNFSCDHQAAEPAIAQPARGFLNGLGRLAVFWPGLGFSLRVNLRFMKRDTEASGQFAAKFEVLVGLRAAQAVMQMRGVQHQSGLTGAGGERAQQRHGVGPAGKTHGKARARPQQGLI